MSHQPDALLLLGDNIYLPTRYKPKNPAELRHELKLQYDRLLSDPHFGALLVHMRGGERKVAAIWDDHDFLGGANYARDFSHSYRDAAKAQFFESLGFAAQPPNIYRSFDLHDARFVLLDCRSWRDPPDRAPGKADDVLGAEQLNWLRAQLQHDRKYTVVCSSLAFYDHGLKHESWGDYPAARAELLSLSAAKAGFLMLSGDLHQNSAKDDDNLIELVSSGVSRNHQWWFWRKLRNYAVLDLDERGAMVSFYENDVAKHTTFSMSLSDWRLKRL
jgi:phosphodiesterase/alkaline phosphatase D-like protein